MRGTSGKIADGVAGTGIIPAYAGNIVPVPGVPVPGVDHPRVCGEHRHLSGWLEVGKGSSPRMRGTLYNTSIESIEFGIIPAYAGNIRGGFFGHVC